MAKTVKKVEQAEKPAIPAVVNRGGLSALANLASKATTKKPATATVKRPALPLSAEVEEEFIHFASLVELEDLVEGGLKQHPDLRTGKFVEAYTTLLWSQKSQPENPDILAYVEVDGEKKLSAKGMFIVQDNIKLKIPDDEATEKQKVATTIQMLKDAGLKASSAIKLVTDEVSFTPETSLRSLNSLLSDKADEVTKMAGEKLMAFIQTLSDEEQAALLVNKHKPTVKDDFLNRVCQYATTIEEAKAILMVFPPVVQIKGACLVTTSMAEKAEKLASVAVSLIEGEETKKK